uniref:Uncharacterized protein n=1 Tax=Acrobeloides nanus TaxID=290746 RepID=A0A914CJQ6_9BILA
MESNEKPSTSRLTDESTTDSSSQTEHFLLVQQLRAQILDLKNTVAQKDQLILERDKKIAQLNAETVQMKNEYKTKMEEQRKNYVNMVNSMKENQRASIKSKQPPVKK